MADILCFSRNRLTTVEQVDDQTMKASCRLQDLLLEAYVEIEVKLPDLEITAAGGKIVRSVRKTEINVPESVQKVIGVRVGPGLKKILKGVMGNSAIDKQVTFMVEECCNGVILSFTKEVLAQAPKGRNAEKNFFKNILKANPRLYKSCAAFSPGSPLVEEELGDKGGKKDKGKGQK